MSSAEPQQQLHQQPPLTPNPQHTNGSSSTTTDQYFSLRWNNYQANFTSVFQQLFESQSFVDVSLACEDHTLQAHKVVLSACSAFFKRILLDNPCKHPTIIMPAEIAFEDLRSIVEFIYRGEIDVPEGSLQSILNTAEQLQIKALSDIELADFSTDAPPASTPMHHHQHRSVAAAPFAKPATGSTSNQTAQTQSGVMPLASRRPRAKRPRTNHSELLAAGGGGTLMSSTSSSSASAGVQTDQHSFGAAGGDATDKWTFADDLQSDDGMTNDGGGGVGGVGGIGTNNVYITTSIDGNDDGVGSASVPDGNGLVVLGDAGADGVAGGDSLATMGFLDFAAEPAAPAATPVHAEHADLMSAVGSGDGGGGVGAVGADEDGVDESGGGDVVRNMCDQLSGTDNPPDAMKFQTLQPMDQDATGAPTNAGNHDTHAHHSNSAISSTARVGKHSTSPFQSSLQLHSQLRQQIGGSVGGAAATATVSSDAFVIATGSNSTSEQQQMMLQQQQQMQSDHMHHQHNLHAAEMLDESSTAQEITIDPDEGSIIMDIDPANIKHEHHHHHHHQQVDVVAAHNTPDPNNHMVTMMTSSGHLVEMYQSDTSDDSKMTDLNDTLDDCDEDEDDDDGSGGVVVDQSSQSHFMQHQLQHTQHQIVQQQSHHIPSGHVTILPTISGTASGNLATTTLMELSNNNATTATSASTATLVKPLLVTASPKTWTQANMDAALEALRAQTMSLTKASVTFGIPSTTLWQRAHRLGIDTPKKEGPSKTWSDDSLNNALEALRNGEISANKASKAYGIPSSTLYKIARREGIRLAAPFNAAPTNWSVEDLERALESIRTGATSVQKASLEFGIPTGTLYGRCKREGIELSRSNPTPWSEENMMEALESVRLGVMSINQAAIHFNLPYSSLYGRFKRGKFDAALDGSVGPGQQFDQSSESSYKFSPNASNFAESPQQQQQVLVDQPQVVYHLDVKAEDS